MHYRVTVMTAVIVALGYPGDSLQSVALLYLDAAQDAGVDPLLLLAISYHESRLRTDRVSRVGACGIMQVIPRWSRWSCEDMQSVQGGIAAGVEALQYWGWDLGHYGGGNVRSAHYEGVVQKYRANIQKIVDTQFLYSYIEDIGN